MKKLKRADFFLFHGENHLRSRERLMGLIEALKKRGVKEIVRLDGEKVNLEEIKQALEAKSLFGDEKLVVIENLLSSPASQRQKEIVACLLKSNYDFPLILWERKEIKRSLLNQLGAKFQIEIFKIPAIIFKFLDSLKPGNHRKMLSWLHQNDQAQQEMVFYLLCQRVRRLILAKDLGQKGLENLRDWQQERLINQARFFSQEELEKLYRTLLKMDYQQKTSQTPFSLFSSLDLLVADL